MPQVVAHSGLGMEIAKFKHPPVRLHEDLLFLKLEKNFISFKTFKSTSYLNLKLSAFEHECFVFCARSTWFLVCKMWYSTQI